MIPVLNILKNQLQNPQELFLSSLKNPLATTPQLLFLLDKKTPEHVSSPSTQVIDFFEKDLRLLSLPKETLDGIWWENANARYKLEDNQRILALLFQALKPKTGQLALSFTEPTWTVFALESQLKQAGFKISHLLRRESKVFLLSQRI